MIRRLTSILLPLLRPQRACQYPATGQHERPHQYLQPSKFSSIFQQDLISDLKTRLAPFTHLLQARRSLGEKHFAAEPRNERNERNTAPCFQSCSLLRIRKGCQYPAPPRQDTATNHQSCPLLPLLRLRRDYDHPGTGKYDTSPDINLAPTTPAPKSLPISGNRTA